MGAFHPSGTSDQASANGNSGNEEQVEFANTYMVDHPEAHELLTGSEGYNTGNEGGKDFTTSTPDANTTRGQESTATRPTAWYNLWNYASDLGGGDASANQQATIGTGDINVAGDRDATSGRTTTQPTGHASAAYARGPDGSGRSPVSLGYGHGESSGNLDKQGSSFFSRLSSRVAGAFGGGGSRTEGTNAISMRASVGQQTGTGGAPDFSGSSSALSRSFEVESPKKMFDGSTGSPGTEQARGVSTLYGATMTGQSRAEMMANEAAMRGSTASGGEVDARGSSFFSLQMLTFGLLGGPGEAKTTAEDGQGGTVSTLSSPTSGAGGSAKSSTSTSLLAHILYALALLVDLGALIILVASPYDSASCDMSLFFALHTLCGLLLDAAQYIAGARAKWQRMIKAGCSNRFSSTSDDPLSISLRSTSVRTNVKGALVVPDGSPAAAASSAFYGLLLKYSMLTLYATFIGFGGYLLITSKGSCGSNRLYYADAALCASASIMLLLTVAASLAEWWATTVTTQGADKVASAAARTLPNFAVILGLPLVFCLTDHTCESKANAVVAGTLAFAAAIDAALCWASLGNDTTTDATDTYLSNVTAFALVAACGLTLGFWSPVCANATFYANIGVLSCILLTLSLNFALTALSTITTRKSASASSPDTDAKTNPEDEPLLASPALEV
ncbi:unnamed protein product [Amoebophrya sp. A25]|nr:unnamed protein product [Amoebophrya sp. A25]|eukprot:GSA25T00020623001.1